MRILQLHPGYDTGGQSVASKRVLEAMGDEVRVFVKYQHPFAYGQAEIWEDAKVRDAYSWADVTILHNEPELFARIDDGASHNLIVHHHGTRFRRNPGRIYAEAEAIGARQVVSTVDLLLSVPARKPAQWFGQVVDTGVIASMHQQRDGERIVISHAPTNRAIKGTRHVIRAMRRIKDADFRLISRQPWHTCLRLKAASDIFVDQLLLGYGNNAIEAWALGLPVLSGASDAILERMRREFHIPFYVTDPLRLEDDLRAFVASADLRAEWAERGRVHVERFHAPEAWAERARRIYGDSLVELAA